MFRLLALLLLISPSLGFAATDEVTPPPASNIAKGSVSNLPLPRFVTLRAETTNLRAGPGDRYPIAWVLKASGHPVEVIAEYDNWRRIRTEDKTEGWVNQALLSGKRSAIVIGDELLLREDATEGSSAVAKLEKNVIGRVSECTIDWCELTIKQGSISRVTGWAPKAKLWGVTASEVFN